MPAPDRLPAAWQQARDRLDEAAGALADVMLGRSEGAMADVDGAFDAVNDAVAALDALAEQSDRQAELLESSLFGMLHGWQGYDEHAGEVVKILAPALRRSYMLVPLDAEEAS